MQFIVIPMKMGISRFQLEFALAKARAGMTILLSF